MKSAAKPADLQLRQDFLGQGFMGAGPCRCVSPVMRVSGDFARGRGGASVPRLQILIGIGGERKRRIDLVKLGFQMFVDQQKGLERRAHAAVT